jgi:hypothetical protein
MNLITILSQTISPNRAELEAAQRFLEQTASNNFVSIFDHINIHRHFA